MIMGMLPAVVVIIHGLFYCFIINLLVMSAQEVMKMNVHHALILIID